MSLICIYNEAIDLQDLIDYEASVRQIDVQLVYWFRRFDWRGIALLLITVIKPCCGASPRIPSGVH